MLQTTTNGGLDLLRERREPPIIADESRDIPLKLSLARTNIQLGAIESHDPQAFYQTRTGLYVRPEFKSRVLAAAKPVFNLGPLSLSSCELTENLHDKDIKAELPAGHVFEDPSELCARIAQMISKQPNGEAGDLVTSGHSNLFYLPDCVAYLYWHARKGWDVHAWVVNGGHWYAGYRVLFCS